MTFYARTFSLHQPKRITLNQARERHKMIDVVVNHVERKVPALAPRLHEVWDALVGVYIDPTDRSMLHDAVEITIPAEHATVVQRSESTPAAFAFCCAVAGLASVDVDDDVAARAALANAWQEFECRRLAANKIREGFGCDDSASWHTLRDIEEMPDGADFQRKMLEIATLAGRMFAAMAALKTTVPTDDPHKVVAATVGGKVERLLPAEIGRLDGETREMTEMKILREQAQVREMKGERPQSRGPLVLTLDESSSMHEEYGSGARGRNTWAKAAAVALTRVAWGDNRAVRCVHFGSSVEVQDVPVGDTRAMFEMARSFLAGGTAFGYALRSAYAQVGDLAAHGHKGADVVVISDGEEYYVGPERDEVRADLDATLDKMDAEGVKLWTVAIGQQHDVDFPLRKRAEKWVFAHDRDLVAYDRASDLAAELTDAAKADPHDVN